MFEGNVMMLYVFRDAAVCGPGGGGTSFYPLVAQL